MCPCAVVIAFIVEFLAPLPGRTLTQLASTFGRNPTQLASSLNRTLTQSAPPPGRILSQVTGTVTFIAYVALGNALDVGTALTSLALFEILRYGWYG